MFRQDTRGYPTCTVEKDKGEIGLRDESKERELRANYQMKCGVQMENGTATCKLYIGCTNSQFLRGSLESVVPSGHIFTVELKHEENRRKLEFIDDSNSPSRIRSTRVTYRQGRTRGDIQGTRNSRMDF